MLRADNVICGTSSTGTGTLTLAACPAPPGGLDFDKWLKATGFNFVSTNAVLVSYTIIEYVDATFASAKQTEKGVGTLTLGASITAATLARTTVQSTVTGLNTSTPSPTFSAPTAITIGTAANTLLFVGVSPADLRGCIPYYQSTLGDFSTSGLQPANGRQAATASGGGLATATDYYHMFEWTVPMLVKRCSVRTGGTVLTGATNNSWGRLYAVGTDGKPGKLLYDFGALGTSTSLNSTFNWFSSGAGGNGFFLMPGVYYFDLALGWTGGSGSLLMYCFQECIGMVNGGNTNSQLLNSFLATAATLGAAPDPANTGTWFSDFSEMPGGCMFALKDS